MLAILPLMAGARWRAKSRVWLALFFAGLAAQFYQSLAFYIAVDLFAGAVVLLMPRYWAQRIIGALFAVMALSTTAYFVTTEIMKGGLETFSSPGRAAFVLIDSLRFLGWLQWATLLAWGAIDAWRSFSSRNVPNRGFPSVTAERVQ